MRSTDAPALITIVPTLIALMGAVAYGFHYDDIDPDRMPPNGWVDTRWNDPGGWTTIDVSLHGLPPNDPSIDASDKLAEIIHGGTGNRILYFPAGVYHFHTTLVVAAGGIRFKGDGLDRTELRIAAPGEQNAEIRFDGSGFDEAIDVLGSPRPGDDRIIVADASSLEVGDVVQLYAANAPLTNRGFSWGHIYSQLLSVTGISGNTLELDMKIGLDYDAEYSPKVRKGRFLRNIGVESLKISRIHQPTGENVNNLVFHLVHNGFVRDIESAMSGRCHVWVRICKNIVLERNYVHDSFVTNRGGFAYGLFLDHSTGCRVTDNKSWNLRHQIILGQGANHNVISYNSVEESYFSYNDLALHAVFSYMNLFEGNMFQEGYADTSKNNKERFPDIEAQTGPGNTWFRNHATGEVGSRQRETRRQNVFANLLGSEASSGFDHYIGANKRTDGLIRWGVFDQSSAFPASLYLKEKPPFLGAKPWPLFGPDLSGWGAGNTLPAHDRQKP